VAINKVCIVNIKDKMMNKYLLIILFMPMLLLASCNGEEKNDKANVSGVVTCHFSLSVKGLKLIQGTKSTRSIDPNTVSDNVVNDLWVLQFQSGILKTCTYMSSVDTTLLNVKLNSGTCNVYFIANAGTSAFSSYVAGTTTETAFQSASKSLSAETDALENGKYVPMYGTIQNMEVPVTGYVTSQKVTLTRILARVTINYTNNLSNFQIRKVQICNVSNAMQYYPPASSTTLFPTSPSSSTENTFNCTIIPSSGYASGSYSFYIPENQRGTGTNTSGSDPTLKAGINYATCIKLIGYTTGSTAAGQEVVYTFYPGANNYNDYNICRNTYYQLTTNIEGTSPVDARVIQTSRANSFIVPPGGTVYIPLARANDSSDIGTQIGDLTASGYTFGTVWANGTSVSCSQSADDRAIGVFEVTAGSTVGNAVVYVKNSSGTILWSWHIWVTNYDPNVTNVAYNGQTWMDRNLGATDNSTTGSYGLYYQWGRKDPFQGQKYTPIVGNGASGNNLALSVQNPSTLYCAGTTSYDWYTDVAGNHNNNLWNSIAKTVYDPCPAGWKIPANGSRNTLTTSNFTNDINSIGDTYTDSPSFFYPYNGFVSIISGDLYDVDLFGFCWSSSYSSYKACGFSFSSERVDETTYFRGHSYSVRCVQDQ